MGILTIYTVHIIHIIYQVTLMQHFTMAFRFGQNFANTLYEYIEIVDSRYEGKFKFKLKNKFRLTTFDSKTCVNNVNYRPLNT